MAGTSNHASNHGQALGDREISITPPGATTHRPRRAADWAAHQDSASDELTGGDDDPAVGTA
ncbi:hypothetical protein [Actinophytocola sediminis]